MPSPLDNLVRIGQLKTEPPARAELDGLLRSGAARIKDAENAQLSTESRFDLAYNAAHAFASPRCDAVDTAARTASWCSRPCNTPCSCHR